MGINKYDESHIYNYVKCLNKIRKCFKIIQEVNEIENNGGNNNNHSDSTKDSNSDY